MFSRKGIKKSIAYNMAFGKYYILYNNGSYSKRMCKDRAIHFARIYKGILVKEIDKSTVKTKVRRIGWVIEHLRDFKRVK